MLDLDQAIELAQKAHEGQWRSPINASIADFESERKEILISGCSYILKNGSHLYEDKDDKYIWKKQQPYITHPLQVMEMMTTDEEKIVAVLHDVFENNKTFELKCDVEDKWYINTPDSKTILISTYVGKALTSLTNNLHLKYEEYISDIVLNKLATKVKIADIVCNLADTPSEHAKQKYLKALPILLKGI